MASKLFALPELRRLPIPDETHTILAWDEVNRTQGLTDAQRREARRNILKRAKELGMDTSNWQNPNSRVHASALVVTRDGNHPNQMPFAGILTWYDVPSDNPPHGSQGRNVLIPSEVGLPALDSLIGQGINFDAMGDWTHHNAQEKVGVITDAWAGESLDDGAIPVYVEGYIYAQDFPDVAMAIQINQHLLGLSYELTGTSVTDGEYEGSPVRVLGGPFYYTGAAILLRDAAAYTNTAIAAAKTTQEAPMADTNKVKVNQDHVQALQTLKVAIQHIDAITDQVMAQLSIPDADKDIVQAAGVDVVANQSADDSTGMEGNTNGGEIHADASASTAGDNTQVIDPTATPVTASADQIQGGETMNEELEALKKTVAQLEAKLAATEAKLSAASDGQAAQRSTVAYPNQLAAAHPQAGGETEYTKLLAAIDADDKLSLADRWAKKIELRAKFSKTPQ